MAARRSKLQYDGNGTRLSSKGEMFQQKLTASGRVINLHQNGRRVVLNAAQSQAALARNSALAGEARRRASAVKTDAKGNFDSSGPAARPKTGSGWRSTEIKLKEGIGKRKPAGANPTIDMSALPKRPKASTGGPSIDMSALPKKPKRKRRSSGSGGGSGGVYISGL